MSILLYEFFHFLASSLAILVCLSSFALFIITFRYERKLNTVWRALGFLLLALTFLILIWERKDPSIDFIVVTVQVFALFSIFVGVFKEPKLVHLINVKPKKEKFSVKSLDKDEVKKSAKTPQNADKREKLISGKSLLKIILLLIFVIILLVPFHLYYGEFLPASLETIATIIIFATIIIQVKRYRADRKAVNLYPLLGYIFLLVRGLSMILYRLPDLEIVLLRQFVLEYSFPWIIALISTFLAFAFLGIWAWKFVKSRTFLRIYVIFISLVILVSTVGSLIYSLFIFDTVENNNYNLILKEAETQSVIMEDKANTAIFMAKLVSEDEKIIQAIKTSNLKNLEEAANKYFENAYVDILRIFNPYGEVLVSPHDPRDKGRVLSNDSTLAFTIQERKQVRDFDVYPGAMADIIITRAFYPIIDSGKVIAAVEIGYMFDNAFVDFSKEKTNLEVSIYTGTEISATTIKTQDNVSRFIGSEEVRLDVIDEVLNKGNKFTTVINRFGEIYYAAYVAIRDVNGQIIGMISVGVPTFILIDDMRQKLLITFMLVAGLSAFISLVGYYLMPSMRTNANSK